MVSVFVLFSTGLWLLCVSACEFHINGFSCTHMQELLRNPTKVANACSCKEDFYKYCMGQKALYIFSFEEKKYSLSNYGTTCFQPPQTPI